MPTETNNPLNNDAEKLKLQLKSQNEEIQKDIIEALRDGMLKMDLIALGYTEEEINRAETTLNTPEASTRDNEEKVQIVIEKIMNYLENEEAEERKEEEENQERLKRIKEKEKKLTELIELRNQLLLEEEKQNQTTILTEDELAKANIPDGGVVLINGNNENALENEAGDPNQEGEKGQGNDTAVKSETKTDTDSEKTTKNNGKKANPEDQTTIQKETSAGVKEKHKQLKQELDKLWFFQIGAVRKKKKEMKLSKQKYDRLKGEEEISQKIKEDEGNKPFMYFAAKKITNPILRQLIENNQTHDIDFRYIKSEDKYRRKYDKLNWLNEDEGFFYFNTFGFIKVIKNVRDVMSEKGEVIYKIVGPDGTIVADNIEGDDRATEIYIEETEKYKKKVEEEFNRLNKE